MGSNPIGSTQLKLVYYEERYRSGCNGIASKAICPQGHVGSNPTLSAMSLFKKQEKQAEITPKDLLKKVQALETKLEKTAKELGDLKQEMRRALTKIGIKRFNPFKEIGGDQSFSVALLDEEHNGVIITSYYGRELNRVYAKQIQAGKSEHELSEEEKEAISQAIGVTKSK